MNHCHPTKYCKTHGAHAIINKYAKAGNQLVIEEFISRRLLLFLDIDGVMNSEQFYNKHGKEAFFKWKRENRDIYGAPFDPTSKALLNKLIEKHNIDIVISSSWRTTLEEMQSMWKERGMSGKVIGITPRLQSRVRGSEIKEYLREIHAFGHFNWGWWESNAFFDTFNFCDIDNYVIVDDDSDMLFEQRNHFVKTTSKEGFNKETYNAIDFIFKNHKFLTPSQTSIYKPKFNKLKLFYDKFFSFIKLQ